MNYEKNKALKETNANKLIELIEKHNLQSDKDIKEHFRKIDTKDTMEYNLYNRKNSTYLK